MQVEICGTVQVVPDNTDLSNKPWCKEVKPALIKRGATFFISGDKYILTSVPFNENSLENTLWRWYLIGLHDGNRYDVPIINEKHNRLEANILFDLIPNAIQLTEGAER